MTRSTSTTRHAIVLGASMAGLLTARVLSEHFDRVTPIERYRLPTARRRGQRPAANAAHLHGLAPAGWRS